MAEYGRPQSLGERRDSTKSLGGFEWKSNYEAINGAGEVRLNEANGRMIIQMGSEIGGTYLRLDRGGQSAISFMGNAGSAMSSRAFFYNGNTGFMDEIYQPN